MTLLEPRPAGSRPRSSVSLRYWQAVFAFREVSLWAFRLALGRAQKAVVAFCYQSSQGSTTLRRELAEVDQSLPLICTSQIPSIDRGGAEQLTALIRAHHVSVIVVDNLSRLMPEVHWKSRQSRYDEAERETLRELRRLTSGYDRQIEAVVFHLAGKDKAERLLAEGLVDRIEEVRP